MPYPSQIPCIGHAPMAGVGCDIGFRHVVCNCKCVDEPCHAAHIDNIGRCIVVVGAQYPVDENDSSEGAPPGQSFIRLILNI